MIEKKSGWTKELKKLTSFLPLDASQGERIYCLENAIFERPKCKTCGIREVSFSFRKYRTYCSNKCARNCPDTQKKQKQTCLERYGVENPSKSPEIHQKKIDTCLKNYGSEFGLTNPKSRERGKQTLISKYGVENISQLEATKQKKIQTSIERFGVENPFQSEELKSKIKQTNLERYGVENVQQSDEIKKRSKRTCLERYGFEHPLQHPDIIEKNQQYRTKKTVIEGHEISYQGYELVGWRILLERGYSFDDIAYKKRDMPVFTFLFKGKHRRYFPDFYIPSQKLIIEIKSTWTMEKYRDLNLAKRQSVLDDGFDFEFWICSNSNILKII